MLIVVIVVLILALSWGGYGTWGRGTSPYGPRVSWSPLTLFIIALLIWLLAGGRL